MLPAVTAGPRSGEVVVLLHGFPQTPTSWREVSRGLAAAGYRVVAPWQRGYGGTAPPRRADEVRLPHLAADVIALADDLGADRFHVVGHDWGAIVAWRLAADRPDRVVTLTALSVPHPKAMLAALPSGQALRSAYSVFFRLPVMPELVLGAAGGRGLHLMLRRTGLPAEQANEYVEHLVGRGLLRAALDWYRANGPTELAVIPPVSVPAQFLWGRHDPAIGRRAAEACARYTDGPFRFEELDEGHWLPEVAANEVAGAVLAHLRSGPRPGLSQ